MPPKEYCTGVLIGNWVEDRTECPKQGTLYFPPKEKIDYAKMKPEMRRLDFRQNRMKGVGGDVQSVILQDSHISCNNFVTTNDLVYNHLNKPLCGPNYRYYRRSKHQWYPQPDNLQCFDDKNYLTEWGLKKYYESEWKCGKISDTINSLAADTYLPHLPHQYLSKCERSARKTSFTRSFQYLMTKPVPRKTKKSK